MLDLRAQYASIRAEVDAAMARVVESQRFILGPEVEALEGEIAAYCGCTYAVGVSSGTDALLAALMALGVGPGDEVITTPFTFAATATAIARLGARAVFVDLEPRTFNVDVTRVADAMTPRTRAIVPVHLYGQMAEVLALREIAGDVPVVEDAAQAIGAEQDGRRAGSVGRAGALSFFPSKNLGAFGDGGMVLTSDAALAERVRVLRSQGQRARHEVVEIGGNFRLDALQAAVLRVKLRHLDAWTEARQRNAARYAELLASASVPVTMPVTLPGRRHVFNQLVVRVPRRDALRAHLAARGIASEVYYPTPLHLQPAFAAWGGEPGDFPEAERASREVLALPVYPELTEDQIGEVVGAIRDFSF